MALSTLYFSPAGAGTQDGSTAANAAPLFSGGAWSTLITGFNFSTGGNSLLAAVMAGTYTITASLTSANFSNGTPSVSNALTFHGADASGNLLSPPSPSWTADQPAWSTSGLPLINLSSAIGVNISSLWRLIAVSGSANTTILIIKGADWINAVNASATVGAKTISADHVSNSVLACSGSTYATVVSLGQLASIQNCRITGSGNGAGINWSSTAGNFIDQCAIIGVGGIGIVSGTSNTAQFCRILNCVIEGCGSDAIQMSSVASQTNTSEVMGCAITGNGGFGINAQSAAHVLGYNNRLDRNTSGNYSGLGNYSDLYDYTTAGSDAADYNNAAGGDYRIASGAGFANRNIGVSQMGSGGSGGIKRVNFDGGF